MKILMVDDDAVSRAVLHKILSSQPEHQISVAEDGVTAWAMLDDPARYFDVVFLDLSMPQVDGFELVQRIRRSTLHTGLEIVVCTGSNDRPTITKAIQLGVRHYIVKPCSEAVVRAKLSQIKPADECPVGERRFGGA
jgi:CheY-like chemotaxis protein